MDIRSRVGEGTRVTVRLPIGGEGPRAAQPVALKRAEAVLEPIDETRIKKSA